jgi:hypothetical protein
MGKKISELPLGVANVDAVVPATNAEGTITEKIKLGDIANLAGPGPQGNQGSQGPQGPQGDQGSQGATGTTAFPEDAPSDGSTYAREDGAWVDISQAANFQLRRGTDAQRVLVTPLEGEPLYTTDTKKLYIGDGATAGGVDVLGLSNLAAPTADVTGAGPLRGRSTGLVVNPLRVYLPDGTLVASTSGKWVGFSWPPYQALDFTDGRITTFTSDIEGISNAGPAANSNFFAQSVGTTTALVSVNCPSLTYIGNNVGNSTNSFYNLTSLSLPSLAVVFGTFNPICNALTTLSLPALKAVGTFSGTYSALTSLSLPALQWAITGFSPTFNALTTLSLPVLTVTGSFSVTSSSLTTISLPALVAVGSNGFTLTCAALTTLTLPTLGTWKACNSSVSITSGALTQASVDGLLEALAYMDGNNGTVLYSSSGGYSVTISGGTNSAPSNSGSTTTAGSNFVCSGTTCTVNLTGHGYTTGDVLRISGVTTATNANRYAVITVVNANQFTYTITSQTSTGTGTATIIKAGASAKALVTRGITLTTN